MLYYRSCESCASIACAKYTRSEIPADGALRCEAGSERKRIHAEEFNQKEKKT